MSIQFLNPEFLWALLALALPIIIHLFNFRKYKKVYFSNLKSLKSLQAEHKRQSKLKHLILLMIRMLAMTALILAFSNPHFYSESILQRDEKSNKLVSLYIDNSFSMNAEGEEGPLLETAQNKAYEIISQLPQTTRFQVFSNTTTPTGRFNHLNRDQAISKIQDITPSYHLVKLSEIVKKITHTQHKGEHTLFLLSDFQKNNTDLQYFPSDTSLKIVLLPLSNQNPRNLFIDTCWFDNPFHQEGQREKLTIRFQNTSLESFHGVPIKLYINDSIRAIANFDIEPKSSKLIELNYQNRNQQIYRGKIEISDYPIIFDNTFYFTYHISRQLYLLSINEQKPNPYLEKLYYNTDKFLFRNASIKMVQYDALHNQNLIILNQINKLESGYIRDLNNYIDQGGNILIIPHNHNPIELNFFLRKLSAPTFKNIDTIASRLSEIEQNASLYTQVFEKFEKNARLPDIYRSYTLQLPQKDISEILWRDSRNRPLLTRTKIGKGSLYLLAFNLDPNWSNVVTHPIFVPTFLNMVLHHNNNMSLFHILGDNDNIFLTKHSLNKKFPFHIQNYDMGIDIIPEQYNQLYKGIRLSTNKQIKKAGVYNITQNQKSISAIAFNYNRQESILDFYTLDELKKNIKNLGISNCFTFQPNIQPLIKTMEKERHGKPLWTYFVILCILFLVIESIINWE